MILSLCSASLITHDYFNLPCFMNLGANLEFSEHLGNKMYVENPVETNLEYYVDFLFFFKSSDWICFNQCCYSGQALDPCSCSKGTHFQCIWCCCSFSFANIDVSSSQKFQAVGVLVMLEYVVVFKSNS